MDEDELSRMDEGIELVVRGQQQHRRMEMDTNVQAEEDPDSRDSGISLGPPGSGASQQSCCSSQSNLVTAIDHVDIHDDDGEGQDQEELIDTFDENSSFQLRTSWIVTAENSPLKKRLRSASGDSSLIGRPTDFSALHQQSIRKEKDDIQTTQQKNNKKESSSPQIRERHPLALSKSNENWMSPASASCSQGSHLQLHRFTSPSSSSFSAQLTSTSSVTFTTHLSRTSLSSTAADYSDLPPSVRSVHRVQSSTVLGYSLDQSWGSPDAFEHYSLITVERPQISHRAFRSIDADTLVNLLDSLSQEQFLKRFILIDCRYPYEFDGGHIWYSENVWETKAIEKMFYPEEEEKFEEINARIPIFYCEYSQKRGPNMAQALRQLDRNRNEMRYPYVDYKEIYLLDQGYRHFFLNRRFNAYCTPQAYVEMYDSEHAEKLKGYESHRRGVKKRRRN